MNSFRKNGGLYMAFDHKQGFVQEAEILKVLGHPVRLKIVAGLCTNECNVKKIWECLGLPQATVSQHLALLKNKGIIEGKRAAQRFSIQLLIRSPKKLSPSSPAAKFSCRPRRVRDR